MAAIISSQVAANQPAVWGLPHGVALLLSAVGGALVVVVTGAARIVQLRRLARRHRRQDSTA